MDFDADNDGSSSEASIGIRPAMDFDADNTDGQTSDASIGIRPAMDFDADTDASSATDAGDSSAPSDASGDAHTTS